MVDISGLSVLILCGGKGTRLSKTVPGIPKSLAPVGGKPFLDTLLGYLESSGVRSAVLCTGYGAADIREYYFSHPTDIRLSYSNETEPLGTAGALKNAEKLIESDPFMVINGDSFSRLDLQGMIDFHIGNKADATIALSPVENTADFGTVELDGGNRIMKFLEKDASGKPGLVNSGVYVFNKSILSLIPGGRAYSLEREVFSALKGMYGFVTRSGFVDIGTEERYNKAKKGL